ncbi:hypothetical protein GUJ93_ZPchr0011g26973 [Zizania palustris]|uniref:Vacuolar sorting receptor thioredoxin-like domain-containing protein n=1 Tax=Zizania palustris TaxID=103762 RepID=A0A8J5WJ19_ZIZPA|nr:hypothetical protein GUJ93_ZPchr0011g26973 [Zizania palustris]
MIGKGPRGDVTILPTLVINNRKYRGKLDKGAVLKAICAGFRETTEPAVCLSDDIQTNGCLENNGGCWQDKAANITPCKNDGCKCPDGFKGDGIHKCEGKSGATEVGWGFLWVIFFGLVASGIAGYAVYKYRIRRYMDSEIRAIMAQYMPLDNQGEVPNHSHHIEM